MDGTTRELTYQYDLEGNRTRVAHPDAYFFQYTFDGLNRFETLRPSLAASPTSNTGSGLSIKYRSTGGRWDITRAGTGAAKTTINPDNAVRLASFQQDFAETSGESTKDLTNAFAYNPANQVETLDQSNTLYNYTDASNRTGTYEPNGLNQYDKVDGQTLQYGGSGNLMQDRAADGTLTTYSFDMENHLVAVTGAESATLRYDVLGRLAKLVTSAGTTRFSL